MTLSMERSLSDKVDELEIVDGTYIVAAKRGMTEKMIYMRHHGLALVSVLRSVNEDRGVFTVYSEFRLSFSACNCLITTSCSTNLCQYIFYTMKDT